MGLSNERIIAQNKIETIQFLADILEAVKSIGDIAELSKIAYSLPEKDQKKAEEGRVIIAQLDDKIAEQRELAKQCEDEQNDIDKRKAEIEMANNGLNEKVVKIENRENKVSFREKEVEAYEKRLNEKETKLNEKELILAHDKDKLKTERVKFEEEQEAARKKAEEIKKLIEA